MKVIFWYLVAGGFLKVLAGASGAERSKKFDVMDSIGGLIILVFCAFIWFT